MRAQRRAVQRPCIRRAVRCLEVENSRDSGRKKGDASGAPWELGEKFSRVANEAD